MTDLDDVVRALFQPSDSEPAPRVRSVERISDGALHVDYHDPGHVYLVTVRRVPRIRLPLERPVPVGVVGGVQAELVQVSVANHIEVTLDAEPGPARETSLRDYLSSYGQWEERTAHATPPPQWPAEQFRRIAVEVSDDVDTPYRLVSGQLGGTGSESTVQWGFRPPPPAAARRLTLTFTSPDGPLAKIDLPLPLYESEHP
ncbi:hypothetical protein ACQEVC_42780 [Plantactinospora sp. CA-294935]|uniref:hypothetical protein n=1 Tax=Plantactinospora sp. CA-294935 TaxID=3240012 RepID=UPI003D8A3AAB